jgi:hypothetical protein
MKKMEQSDVGRNTYLSLTAIKNLKAYKYLSNDPSYLYAYFLSPVSEFLV